MRERNLLTVEEAVRKMTSLPAANMGIADRGLIQPGYYADLVLFDPDLVSDRATIETPNETSDGIHQVWVNGVLVYDTDGTTGNYPGQVLRHNR